MYLGIDLGTSSVKLVLMDDNQKTIGQTTYPLTISQTKPLWSEQNPDDWWQGMRAGMFALKNEFQKEFKAIKAIGFSGQQHGATLLDCKGRVLRPAILWNDGRAFKECEYFADHLPDHTLTIGARMMPGFTAPKILWIKRHEPHHFERLSKILLPKDYLRFKMTHDYATDMSDASGTGWLNIKNRKWSETLLAATNLTLSHMPTLYEGNAVTGTIAKEIALEFGLSSSTKIIAGGGDNPATALGMNVVEEGSAFLSLGTSGVFFVASHSYFTEYQEGVHSFCHCLPLRYHHMTVHLSAASCLTWFAKTMQCSEAALLSEVEEAHDSTENLLFLPYLSGERSPHNNPFARGVFFGLNHQTRRVHMTQAILEGIAFAFADGQTAMIKAGVKINDVFVVGGGAKSLYWGKILASALNRSLIYCKDREVSSAKGAALLAFLATHPNTSLDQLKSIEAETIVTPDAKLVNEYEHKRKQFMKLYQQLESVFDKSY